MSEESRDSASLVGTVVDGRYTLLSLLGEGGMGAVFEAQAADGSRVAVKLLHAALGDNEEIRQRFERETAALFALRHPHVLAANDAGLYEGSPYLVMELLKGRPLDKLTEDGPLDPALALRLIRQILLGLAFAHEKGAAHRDLKSENVFVVDSPEGPVAKLVDFGLVKFTDSEKWGDARKLTVQGSVFGTPAYMAPEQALGKETDARTDVYAVGCILFELLTGEWPFMEETQLAMLQAQIMKKPRLVADTNLDIAVRPELDALIQRAMAKKPPERFEDARAMLAALDAIPSPPAVARPADGTDPFAPPPMMAPLPVAPQAETSASEESQRSTHVGDEVDEASSRNLLLGLAFVVFSLLAGAVFVWFVE